MSTGVLIAFIGGTIAVISFIAGRAVVFALQPRFDREPLVRRFSLRFYWCSAILVMTGLVLVIVGVFIATN